MAFAIDRDNTIAHAGMGLCYAREGRWPEAKKEYSSWLELEPWNSEARMKLAEAISRSAIGGPVER
jgi:hypothetical protein